MDALFSIITPAAFAAACAVTLAAGFVKGAVGFAMPLIMVSGMAMFLPPQVVVAGVILPIVVTNVMQVARFGWSAAIDASREFRRYILIVCVMIVFSAQLLTLIPERAMYLVLGIPTLALSAVQLLGLRFRIPEGRRGLADAGIGGTAGLLGGLSGIWGPPTVLYLMALDTPKDRQIVVQGVVYGLGAVVLLGAHLKSGVLNAATLPLSAALLVPGILGMWLGFRLSDRFDAQRFRRATLIVLVVSGANLIRRGLTG